MAEATLDMRQVMRQIRLDVTVRVAHLRETRVRMWLATWLMGLAARLLGCGGIDVDIRAKGP